MKRRLVSLVIIMVICLSFAGNALALNSDEVIMQPFSTLSIACGLSASGSQYKVWARTKSGFSDDLTASVSLYQVVNGEEVFITSASASGTGTMITASKLRTLTSGTYKVYGYGTGGTSSGSNSSTVTIP